MDTGLDFHLPASLIAQEPAEPRDSSRLMVVWRGGHIHERFSDLPSHLGAGDLLVYNDSRVVPAGLSGSRSTGGRVQALVVGPFRDGHMLLIRGKVRAGETLNLGGSKIRVIERVPPGWLCASLDGPIEKLLEGTGAVQLPPYIKKCPPSMERYQTVYASRPGSLAAPTAGLHFTTALMERLSEGGVGLVPVTLHIGPATFLPDRSVRGAIPPEPVEVPKGTAEVLNSSIDEGRRIFAVGTTAVKALESMVQNGRVKSGTTLSSLRVSAGSALNIPWSGMVTNFHLPGSSNLELCAAMAGSGRLMAGYREAISLGYRFYSFGDSMMILR